MERCSIMGLGIRHDGSHWWQSLVAIEGGLIWWTDWLDGCLKRLRWTLSDKFRLDERVVWSLCTATLMLKQASQPGENS